MRQWTEGSGLPSHFGTVGRPASSTSVGYLQPPGSANGVSPYSRDSLSDGCRASQRQRITCSLMTKCLVYAG